MASHYNASREVARHGNVTNTHVPVSQVHTCTYKSSVLYLHRPTPKYFENNDSPATVGGTQQTKAGTTWKGGKKGVAGSLSAMVDAGSSSKGKRRQKNHETIMFMC